jgi:short-subunit dehydrogenase
MRVNGRTVLITGASSGIGEATALAMARGGARVLLLARRQRALEAVATRIANGGGQALAVPVDLTDLAAVDAAAQMIRANVGVPDVVVNNAGAGRWLYVEETPRGEEAAMMAVPYLAAFAVTRAFLPGMLARGSGHIVNVTSLAAYLPWPGATGYAAVRWAMRGFSEALAADLAGTGIGVSLVVPPEVDTPYFDTNPGTRPRIPNIARLYPTLSADAVARAIVRAVERNRREVILPWTMRLTLLSHRLFPALGRWLVVRTGWKRQAA